MAESPGAARAVGLSISSAKLLPEVGGLDKVGDGTSSESLGGGSFRDSEFQIPVPHGNELLPAWPQLTEPLSPGLVFVAQFDWSVPGLAGDKGPTVGSEAFFRRLVGTSLSQDVRRPGLGAGAIVWINCDCSPSSSDDAKASESGVERRTPGRLFSSMTDALLADPGGVMGLDA